MCENALQRKRGHSSELANKVCRSSFARSKLKRIFSNFFCSYVSDLCASTSRQVGPIFSYVHQEEMSKEQCILCLSKLFCIRLCGRVGSIDGEVAAKLKRAKLVEVVTLQCTPVCSSSIALLFSRLLYMLFLACVRFC